MSGLSKDDIIRMAREVGIPETATEGVFIANSDDLGRLIAAEREACAKVAEWVGQDKNHIGIAAAIRARGQG
jgi:hypothetical protein